MNQEQYENIIKELHKLQDMESKRDYLDSHIEENDFDCNGLNEELIQLRDKINKEINRS